MTRRKKQEEFEKEIYNLFGDEYTVLGIYINCHTKIKILQGKTYRKPTPLGVGVSDFKSDSFSIA